jgi:hypothetical protein
LVSLLAAASGRSLIVSPKKEREMSFLVTRVLHSRADLVLLQPSSAQNPEGQRKKGKKSSNKRCAAAAAAVVADSLHERIDFVAWIYSVTAAAKKNEFYYPQYRIHQGCQMMIDNRSL